MLRFGNMITQDISSLTNQVPPALENALYRQMAGQMAGQMA